MFEDKVTLVELAYGDCGVIRILGLPDHLAQFHTLFPIRAIPCLAITAFVDRLTCFDVVAVGQILYGTGVCSLNR